MVRIAGLPYEIGSPHQPSALMRWRRSLYFGGPMILPAIVSLVFVSLMLLGFWAVAN